MGKLLGLATIQSLLLAFTQCFAKLALEAFGKFEWSWRFAKIVFTNWQFAVFGVFGISSFALYAYILKNYEFSLAYPLTCISYIFGLVLAMLVFHETIPVTRWIGVAVIMLGVFLVLK